MDINQEMEASVSGKGNELMGISIAGKVIGLVVVIWLISISYYAFAFFALAPISFAVQRYWTYSCIAISGIDKRTLLESLICNH